MKRLRKCDIARNTRFAHSAKNAKRAKISKIA